MRLPLSIIFFLVLQCIFLTAHAATGCNIRIERPVSFGIYSRLNGSAKKITGSLRLNCGGDAVSYSIALSPGHSGNYFPRSMHNDQHLLHYNLYLNPSHTTVWGNGHHGTQQLSNNGTCSGRNICRHIIYGSIPAGQKVAPGNYIDTIHILVTY